jgi:hypothetical protein
MRQQSTPKNVLGLPPDVVGAIYKFMKPAHVLDAAPTAKAWGEAGESGVWDGLVAQAVRTAVRATLAVGGAPTDDAKADAAVEAALERCEQKARKWAAKSGLASAKARAWYAIGVALPPVTAAVVAEVLPYRCVISLDRRVYDCTKFVFEGAPYHHPGGSSNIRREHGRDVGRFFDVFAHTATAHRLMRKEMLAWDGPAYCGAPSLPACVLARSRRSRRTGKEARFSLGHVAWGVAFAAVCRFAAHYGVLS